MKHSKQFWDKKYAAYRAKLKTLKSSAVYNKARFKPLPKHNFQQAWDLITKTDDKMKYLIDAQTKLASLEDARKVRRQFAAQGIDVSIDEVRSEGTFNLAKKYNLSAVYQRLRAEGKSIEEAQAWISFIYFGSK